MKVILQHQHILKKKLQKHPNQKQKKVKFANEPTTSTIATNKEIKKSKSKEELTPKGETTPTAMSTEKPSEWSTDQQKQLETALKKYPASDTERWDKISAAVTGKSKQECIARFKEIREAILKKKASSIGSRLIILPECFNSPYGTQYFEKYAEEEDN